MRAEPRELNLLALHGDRVLQLPLAHDARLVRLIIKRATHISVAHPSLVRGGNRKRQPQAEGSGYLDVPSFVYTPSPNSQTGARY